MSNLKTFIFSPLNNKVGAVSVKIRETVSPEYHAFVWPCAIVMGQYITWRLSIEVDLFASSDLGIIEIGAGCALPSIIFAKMILAALGQNVSMHPRFIATDHRRCYEKFAEQFAVNIQANDLEIAGKHMIETYPLEWGQFPDKLPNNIPSRKIIICADCFYNTKCFEDVVVTISYLLHLRPDKLSECWCAVQIRSANHSIAHLLNKWSLKFEKISLHHFNADSTSIAESSMPGQSTIEMYIFKAK